MNKDRARKTSLASLAVSVSAAALLGVSGLAHSGPGDMFCRYGESCSILPWESPTGYGAVGMCVIGEGYAECACGAQVPDPSNFSWQYAEVPYSGDCWVQQ